MTIWQYAGQYVSGTWHGTCPGESPQYSNTTRDGVRPEGVIRHQQTHGAQVSHGFCQQDCWPANYNFWGWWCKHVFQLEKLGHGIYMTFPRASDLLSLKNVRTSGIRRQNLHDIWPLPSRISTTPWSMAQPVSGFCIQRGFPNFHSVFPAAPGPLNHPFYSCWRGFLVVSHTFILLLTPQIWIV